jgi:poly-gamma-glutamate synthesis protein (capsule biosynthesis protein)
MNRCFLLALAAASPLMFPIDRAAAQDSSFGPGDPPVQDATEFDAKRPVERELLTSVPDGFVVTSVGDLIISRPLSQYAPRIQQFGAVIERLKKADITYGNLETTIFDPRSFQGSPYSWDGDWTNASLPAVARDLRAMGFGVVSRANNHSLDWGLEGMRETSRWLDEAGIVHAGTGETHGLARAPQYLEGANGRIALVSLASTFRPTSESLPAEGATPGRPGLSALHVSTVITLPAAAFKSLVEVECSVRKRSCGKSPAEVRLFGATYRRGKDFSYDHVMDPTDLAEIYRSIRAAQQNSDFVIVSIHAHECSSGCDDDNAPRGAARFLKELARGAIDSGADLFVATGNHNLGPVEIYKSRRRGYRPIFYGLGNFFWSDVQELLGHDLFRGNRELLGRAWKDPSRATEYDLTAPLNKGAFANRFTFESVIAEARFEKNELARIELHAIEEGYGHPLVESGIPRLVTDASAAAAIFKQIVGQTAQFGLPRLNIRYEGGSAIIEP